MKIIVFGAGVQGTLYGVRLARSGHDVTIVARQKRAADLRDRGAVIHDVFSGRIDTASVQVVEDLTAESSADLCIVAVRREQVDEALPKLVAATRINRFLFMVNHANGSEALYAALGRTRVVVGFPGAAGGLEDGIDMYVEVAEQPTVIEATAPDVAAIIREAGFHVDLLRDVESWLRRHAIFVTAIGGALYEVDCDPNRLAADAHLLQSFIVAVREGWAALDKLRVAPPPVALRAIFCWVPVPFAVNYWRSLLRSARGDLYFARHTRHAPREMAALAGDIRSLTSEAMPHLRRLYAAIDRAAARPNFGGIGRP
jgi:2-dehydropantoate 2-reductase